MSSRHMLEILTYMGDELLRKMVEANRTNAELAGAPLVKAATTLVTLARSAQATVFACDAAGERIVGAALILDGAIAPLLATSTIDSDHVILVSGAFAGAAHVAQAASDLRADGVRRVTFAGLRGCAVHIDGVDVIVTLDQTTALAVA